MRAPSSLKYNPSKSPKGPHGGPAPFGASKRFCRRQKPCSRANSLRPGVLKSRGPRKAQLCGAICLRPVRWICSPCLDESAFKFEIQSRQIAEGPRSGPAPFGASKRFCRRQKPCSRANSFRPGVLKSRGPRKAQLCGVICLRQARWICSPCSAERRTPKCWRFISLPVGGNHISMENETL